MEDRMMTDVEFFAFLEDLYDKGDFQVKKYDTPELRHVFNSVIVYMDGTLTTSANRKPC